MSYLAQFLALKLPILAGAGILSVSLAGACAAIVGTSLTIEAELISAVVGMATASIVVSKRLDE